MIVFPEREIKDLVKLDDEAISIVRDAFTSLATKNVEMPPIMRVDIAENNGEVDVKTAYIPGYDLFAIKVSSGFFNNYKLGLPSGNGLMMLLSAETGIPKAILHDNGYLTDVRTAAAGAVAADCLAKKHIHTAGVIGAGSQARFQMKALKQVRDFQKIVVYGPTPERVQDFKEEIEAALGVSVEAVTSAEAVVKQSEVVVTTTPSKSPVIQSEWLHPGLHITAMGSDAESKQELDPGVLEKAAPLVCDVKSQCIRLGELHHAVGKGVIDPEAGVTELGQLTSGKVTGRTNDEQITVCDLTGTGVQDTAIALYAYKKLTEKKPGNTTDSKKTYQP